MQRVEAATRAHFLAHAADFRDPPFVAFNDIGNPLKVQLLVWWCTSFSGEDVLRAATVKSRLLDAVQAAVGAERLTYTDPARAGDRPKMD